VDSRQDRDDHGGQLPAALDDATLGALREESAAHGGPFIDPVLYRRAGTELHATRIPAAWLTRVTGRPVTWWGNLSNRELWLALHAAEADAGRLDSIAAEEEAAHRRESEQAAAAAQAAAQAKRDAWANLRARLPVPVEVWHNWTARHLDGYEQGADHIVVRAALRAGRLCREAGQPLCWTTSRAHELRYVEPNPGDEKRIPTCKDCLRRAENLAAARAPAAPGRRARATGSTPPGSGARRSPSRLRASRRGRGA
jgi:hypothetical protein